ncbi:MAG TPA: ribosomal-processing cysteine protease Prp [Enterococcus columbae]|nr:ribosomal-processing cysteine protease Prp [Enterococcus columbae]
MIKGIFYRNESGMIHQFCISGHAGAGEYGEDIVCAAVSALSLNAINSVDSLAGVTMQIEADHENGGFLQASITDDLTQEQKNVVQVLLESLLLGLESVQEEYQQYIQIQTITNH